MNNYRKRRLSRKERESVKEPEDHHGKIDRTVGYGVFEMHEKKSRTKHIRGSSASLGTRVKSEDRNWRDAFIIGNIRRDAESMVQNSAGYKTVSQAVHDCYSRLSPERKRLLMEKGIDEQSLLEAIKETPPRRYSKRT